MQRRLEQPRIGLGVLAEGDDARAGRFGRAREPLILRNVAIDHRRAAGLEAAEDFRLGVGNRLDRAEIFEMHRRDGGDDRDMRLHQPRQRLDLAGMVHAHLEHREARARGTARQRQRHAPVIVVGGDRGMGLARRREREPQRLLGAGLADRAGDADHLGLRARARGAGEIAQAFEHVRHDQQRRVLRERVALVGGDDREAGAVGERGRHEFVAVAGVALDREERLAAPDAAAVDGDAGDRSRQRAAAARRPWPAPSRRRSRAEHCSCRFPPQRGSDRLVVAERQRLVADNLAGFVALAGDQQHVALAQLGDAAGNRLAAVADLDRAGRGFQDRARECRPAARCADCRRSR